MVVQVQENQQLRTTCCQTIKKLGYHADYVSEVAKELVYAKDFEHLDGTLKIKAKYFQNKKGVWI